MSSKFVEWITYEPILTPIKLSIKQSTFTGSTTNDQGVFSDEFIPANTFICKDNLHENSVVKMINDLDYHGSANDYEQMEHNPNLIYVRILMNHNIVYIKTRRDIQQGEELTRHYGPDYWYGYEYRKKHNDTLKSGKVPADYCFLDEFREDLSYNWHLKIFVKCVNGYYSYVIGFGIKNSEYLNIEKFNKLPMNNHCDAKYLIDISKPDQSCYDYDEAICYDGRYFWRTNYLLQLG